MEKNNRYHFALSRFKPYYLYRLFKWKMGDRSPMGVSFKITAQCPLECAHCAWRKWDIDELPTERWIELIDRARKMGCRTAVFEGGEPTLRKDLDQLISYAKNKGFITQLFTNAVNPLVNYSPDVYWISVDGVGKTHDKIRGEGVFDMVIENITPIEKNKIITWTTISKYNMDCIEEVCKYFSDLVGGMMFEFFYPYKYVPDLSLSTEERVKVGQKISSLKSKYNILNSDSFLNSLDEDYPVYPWMNIIISPDGEIHQGCPIDLLQGSHDCSKCYTTCCRTPAHAYHFKRDTLSTGMKILNFESSMLLWVKHKI